MTPAPLCCRNDAEERPELCRGSVEYVATPEYMVRPPMASTHFFLVDATSVAVGSGALAAACSCISRVLDDMQAGEAGNRVELTAPLVPEL